MVAKEFNADDAGENSIMLTMLVSGHGGEERFNADKAGAGGQKYGMVTKLAMVAKKLYR